MRILNSLFLSSLTTAGFFIILLSLPTEFLSAQPTLAWVRQLPSPESRHSLGLDGAGNVYVLGHFEGNAQIAGIQVQSSGPNYQRDYLVAKFSSEGVLRWVHVVSGPAQDYAVSLAVDRPGRCYVLARTPSFQFPDRLDLGDGVTVDDGTSYLLCLNSDGKSLWANHLNGYSNGDLALGPQGDCYLTTLAYFPDPRGPVALQRFSPNGEQLWESRFGGSSTDEISGVAVNQSNEVTLSGIVYLPARFEGEVFNSPGEPWQGFVAKYSADGKLSWVRSATNVLRGRVSVDREANSYVAGDSRVGDLGVQCYDRNGRSKWKVSEPYPHSVDLFTDLDGNTTTSSAFNSDVVPIFRKYTAEGVLQWKYTEPSGFPAKITGIAENASGNLYVVGWAFYGSESYLAKFSRDDEAALTLAQEGEGTIFRTPEAQFYRRGDSVSLTALAAPWFAFRTWSDGVGDRHRLVTVGDSNFYKAVFYPTTAVETLSFSNATRVAPVGMPYVLVDGVFNPANVLVREQVAEVSIHSSLTNGVIFYTLDGSEPTYSSKLYDGPFVLRESRIVRAVTYDGLISEAWPCDPVSVVFEVGYTVSNLTRGGGRVLESPSGPWHAKGSVLTVTASPDLGWKFLQWRGALTSSKPVENVPISRNLCLEAVFGTAIKVVPSKGGSVAMVPSSTVYPYGSPVQISAHPEPGYAFASWGNAVISTQNPLTYSVTNSNPTISAVFVPLGADEVSLDVDVLGNGRVQVKPSGNRFRRGQRVELVSTPDAGQAFLGWTGEVETSQSTIILNLDRARSVTASFSRSPLLSVAPCFTGAPAEPLRLLLQGEMGIRYEIEQSFLGVDWVSSARLTNTLGITEIVIPAPTGSRPVFYRAVREF